MTSRSYSSTFDASVTESSSLTLELFRIVLTILFPPLGVFLRVGLSMQFLLSVLLTIMAYVPGLVHGIWLLAQTSDHRLRVERA